MLAYRSSFHAMTKYGPSHVVLDMLFRLPVYCLYETRSREHFPTPSDFLFNPKREVQRVYLLVRAEKEVRQTRQKNS